MTPVDDFTQTLSAAAAFERWHADEPPTDDRPSRAELAGEDLLPYFGADDEGP